jgi:hypothetical protein
MTLFHVTRYDEDGRVTTAVVPVEAESKERPKRSAVSLSPAT